MTARQHEYRVHVAWRGNTGAGTAGYRAYERTWELTAEGRAPLRGSADPALLGSAGTTLSGCSLTTGVSARQW
jgi:hypothetical protein